MTIAGSGSGSGSTSQRHGSADPDPDPDPPQNVMDPEYCLMSYLSASGRSPMMSAPSSSQPLYRKESNYWLPGYCTCPPREEASSDKEQLLATWILYLSTKGRSLFRQRAAIGYLDIVP